LPSSTRIASQWPARSFDQVAQQRERALVGRVAREVGQLLPGLARVDLVDRVPGRQVEVVAGRHLAAVAQFAAQAQQRHHLRQAQVFVEVGAADVHAAGGEDVVAAFRAGRRGPARAAPA
jgi:hypothetical protein